MEPIDICYTPLDIPNRPDIDMSKFLNWVKNVYPQPCKDVAVHAEKDFNVDYTWDLVFGASDGKWQNDFDKEFPELAEYCYKAFGIYRHELATAVFLPVRETIQGVSFWHNDVDMTGFRFYLECEHHEKNPLLLRKTVEKYDQHIGIVVPLNGDDDRLQKEAHICKMTDPHMSFYLNNIRAVHAPTVYVPGIRIAGFVTVKKTFADNVLKRTRDLIVSSANKYKDHAILW
jgi:hypothetical protein